MDLTIICNHYFTMQHFIIQQFKPEKFEYNLQLKKKRTSYLTKVIFHVNCKNIIVK